IRGLQLCLIWARCVQLFGVRAEEIPIQTNGVLEEREARPLLEQIERLRPRFVFLLGSGRQCIQHPGTCPPVASLPA
ncbi:hypothetical protein, partial [Burkholderia cenocepacia]|uniref:hypothetical protein n=1 Tax=Burkholderia cenocepacia TaxID=95486 RepID=UPI004043B807